MHLKDAAQLRKLWGDHVCHHPEYVDEQDDDFGTGSIVCVQCGQSFRDVTALEAHRAEQLPGPAPAMPTGSETILVVEDERAIRRAMKRVLEAAGYSTLFAQDGEEALETALEHRKEIDLIISDLMMPKRGGFWLLQSLEEKRIPAKVLVMTGYSDLTQRSALSPDTALLHKPWTIPELLAKVRETLDS
jgi:CheY-like chemotaxis protein